MIRMKIAEAKGTVDVEEMHDLQEKLQMCNKELSQAKDDQLQLQKRLKSTEVRIKIKLEVINTYVIILIYFRVNPAV